MCFRDQLKMDGLSTSLEDSPCISVCSTTYGLKDSCICGRNLKQISSWNSYDTVTKKKIVMNASDILRITASQASAADVTLSVLEIT